MPLYFSGCQLLQSRKLPEIKALYGWQVKVCIVRLPETTLLVDDRWWTYVSLVLGSLFHPFSNIPLPPPIEVVDSSEPGWQEQVRTFIAKNTKGGFEVAREEFEKNRTFCRIDKTVQNLVIVLGSAVFPEEVACHKHLITDILNHDDRIA
jgi:hypothetical protein